MPDSNNPARARNGAPLTRREQEVLALLSAGDPPEDIAGRLGIALNTVKSHVSRIHRKIGAKPQTDPLTRRQLEILALLAAGQPTREIAEQLGISQGTVKAHLTTVYRKIGAKNRVQATRHYLDQLAAPSEQV